MEKCYPSESDIISCTCHSWKTNVSKVHILKKNYYSKIVSIGQMCVYNFVEMAEFVSILIYNNVVVTQVLDHSHKIFNVLCLHDVTEHSPGRVVWGKKEINL